MLILDPVRPSSPAAVASGALMRALDMGALWQACAALVTKVLPCHSCSLMFDIDGYEPQQGRHFIAGTQDHAPPVTSLAVSAPYLAANPQVRWYTFSQIASQDELAAARLRAQNPAPGWREFIHLAFWNGDRLDAVLSIRIRAEHTRLSDAELAFLGDLHPVLDAGLQRVRALESERVRHRAFEALLHRLPLATAVVDERLTPLYLSSEARRICQRWSDAAPGRRLPEAVEHGLRQAMRTPGAWPDDALGESRMVALAHPRRGLRMRVEVSAPLALSSFRAHHILTFAPDAAAEAPAAHALPLLQRLSPSERRVAALIADGLRNADIAARLSRSPKTIESQISAIYRKLDVENRAQLVRLLT
ncbi:helix-turn-helix transcriptional regulator [Luteimonas sp. FCS-9]|uniref:helix-turn-helix transcriptional regulator n=1 Tax=Luteimonas sp. FCS-9 TaxID=1547516 RepID=UPI0006996C97|nr:helix-turn-helix transcriptional regulator [Luteimonas sp. FCS-9]